MVGVQDLCPKGYICDGNNQTSCEQIRTWARDDAKLGDIHAGLYCPGGPRDVVGYENCPIGFYCPDSLTKKECPKGKFCPHKTAIPSISCGGCEKGSKKFARSPIGTILILMIVIFVIIYLVWMAVMKCLDKVTNRQQNLIERRLDEAQRAKEQKDFEARLQKIRPKLELIARRLPKTSMSGTGLFGSNPVVSTNVNGHIVFDTKKLFDACDSDGDGILTYDELNVILEISPIQLVAFVNRMNELDTEHDSENTVSRRTFVNYFLPVLESTSHLEPTSEEAASRFDEIASQGMLRARNGNSLKYKSLYSSSLSKFLSELQIRCLIKELQIATVSFEDDFERGDEKKDKEENENKSTRRRSRRVSIVSRKVAEEITKTSFVELYPAALLKVISQDTSSLEESLDNSNAGVDITFENLSLTVTVGSSSFNVVDKVTGRLKAGTMTALMGGSGAGKTSLLNALCGRAHYGEVSGVVKINGNEAYIDDHTDACGFVPQDDIVYAELTVRENLMYSGRFQLPPSTSITEIRELAEITMASLGLARIADSIVGDVTRRGVSGGEKKRVNIGLELMSRPSILFLDEPTSGLDSSSAALVMNSLKNLVKYRGVTVCTVIHQPRKFIYDLFDSLILLGVGGKLVFHGPASDAEPYFNALNYTIPPGESVADWLIDVSSGTLAPSVANDESNKDIKDTSNLHNAGNIRSEVDLKTERREALYLRWIKHFDAMKKEKKVIFSPPLPYELPETRKKRSFVSQLVSQLKRNFIVSKRNVSSKMTETAVIVLAVIVIAFINGVVEPTKEHKPEILYESLVFNWTNVKMNEIDDFSNEIVTEDFLNEVTTFESMKEYLNSNSEDLSMSFDEDPRNPANYLEELFEFATRPAQKLVGAGVKFAVIISVLVGLGATKILTEKRQEFFREAGSGFNINSYFLAVNITLAIENFIQISIAATCALYLRNTLASWFNYYIAFNMLAWLSSSWAVLFPLIIPPKNIVLVTGLFMVFFSLLCSGVMEPVLYKSIYKEGAFFTPLFSGFLSPSRYFTESLAVNELRCLPAQTGFTNPGDVRLETGAHAFNFALLGVNDFYNVTTQSCSGWHWGVLPSFLVGILIRLVAAGLIHVTNRSKQSKKSLGYVFKKSKRKKRLFFVLGLFGYFIVLLGLFILTSWLILKSNSPPTLNQYQDFLETVEFSLPPSIAMTVPINTVPTIAVAGSIAPAVTVLNIIESSQAVLQVDP